MEKIRCKVCGEEKVVGDREDPKSVPMLIHNTCLACLARARERRIVLENSMGSSLRIRRAQQVKDLGCVE